MQLFQDPSGTGQIFRSLVILHQLFNDRRINPRLLAFLALFFSLLLLGHFHLLSQVVTHTQNFPTPSGEFILVPRGPSFPLALRRTNRVLNVWRLGLRRAALRDAVTSHLSPLTSHSLPTFPIFSLPMRFFHVLAAALLL